MSSQISELDQAIERYRRALLRRERAAAVEMVRAYGEIWKRVEREIRELVRVYYEAQARGEAVSSGWLYQMERLQALRRQVETELRQFAQYADGAIRAQQWEAAEAARREALDLVQRAVGPLPPGVELMFNRLPSAAIENLVGALQAGSPVWERLQALAGSGAQGVVDGLIQGLALGLGAREIARIIRQGFGGNLAKALMWARTETIRAYHKTSHATYRANNDVVKGWTWRSARNERTCAMCWAMDGKVFGVDDEIDDHPNGRCTAVPVTKTWEELGFTGIPEVPAKIETGPDAFARLPEAQQLKILGPAKYAALQDGAISLVDLVGRKWDAKWGWMRFERSLKDVLGEEAKNYYGR